MQDPPLGSTVAVQDAELADMADNLHTTTVRIDMDWGYVQYEGPTSYDWSLYDPAVAQARAYGMSILFLIQGTPAWASALGGSDSATTDEPASAAAFASFCQQVAERYGSGGPTSYEIWNEENNVDFWTPAPNPALYTQVLQDSYTAIKAVEPHQTVITGGLAPETTDSEGDIAPVTFLQDIYADGAQGYFDAVGYHPYSYDALPDTYESWSGWSQMSATTPSIRSVMTANGDADMQVWITEVGWPSNTADLTGIPGPTADADEVQQVMAFARVNSWVGPIYWYEYEDDPSGPFGLVTTSGTQKPAYTAMEKDG